MAAAPEDRLHAKRRRHARLDLLKRRVTVASTLGFAALFGLAAQHTVNSSSSGRTRESSATRATANVTPTTFFDRQSGGFAFDDTESQQQSLQSAPQSSVPSSPPVAQTSVS